MTNGGVGRRTAIHAVVAPAVRSTVGATTVNNVLLHRPHTETYAQSIPLGRQIQGPPWPINVDNVHSMKMLCRPKVGPWADVDRTIQLKLRRGTILTVENASWGVMCMYKVWGRHICNPRRHTAGQCPCIKIRHLGKLWIPIRAADNVPQANVTAKRIVVTSPGHAWSERQA